MKSISISVSNLDCASCVPIIKKSLSKVRGVQEVRTAVMLNRVIVDYDPGEADVAEIRKAVEKAGFKALHVSEYG